MGDDFRGFLKEMEETREDGFIRIRKEVDTRYEVAAIVRKLEQKMKVPLIIFENVKGSPMPVAINCNASRGRVAHALGVPKKELEKIGTIDNAVNIPVDDLRQHLDTLDKDKTYVLCCAVGQRAYIGHRILKQKGFQSSNLSGGYVTYSSVKEKIKPGNA